MTLALSSHLILVAFCHLLFWHNVLGSWGAKKSNASTTCLKPGSPARLALTLYLPWRSLLFLYCSHTSTERDKNMVWGNLSLVGRLPTTQTNINYVPVPIPPTFLPCSRVKQCSMPSSRTEAVWVTTLRQEFYLLDSGAQQFCWQLCFRMQDLSCGECCDSDTPLCPGLPNTCTRQLPFSLWDSHLPDLKHQTIYFLSGVKWWVSVSMQVTRHLRITHFGTKLMAFNRAELNICQDTHKAVAIPIIFFPFPFFSFETLSSITFQ